MKRDKTIKIRVNELEKARMEALAQQRGKPLSEYLRWLVDRDEVAIATQSPTPKNPDQES